MKYEIEFRKEAQLDILEAISWYDERRKGLGDEFFLLQSKTKNTFLN